MARLLIDLIPLVGAALFWVTSAMVFRLRHHEGPWRGGAIVLAIGAVLETAQTVINLATDPAPWWTLIVTSGGTLTLCLVYAGVMLWRRRRARSEHAGD